MENRYDEGLVMLRILKILRILEGGGGWVPYLRRAVV